METKINNTYAIPILTFNITLLIIFSSILTFKIYPMFTSISEQKSELFAKYTDYNRIAQQGIDYDEFIEQKNQDAEASEYLKDLTKAIPQTFYDKNIKNTSGGNFTDFIQNKISKIDRQKKDQLVSERDKKLDAILPLYSDTIGNIGGQENLTDFKFANYIESLLSVFDLTSNDSIGISEVVSVEDYADVTERKKQNSLDTNIFYIPLKLSLEGKKKNMIDFLYFIENVGSINVDKDKEISFYEDLTFKKKLHDGVQNIFGSQIFDIEYMTIPEYLDTRFTPLNIPLLEYINQTQPDDIITMDFQLRFYVRGLPDYLVKKYIKDTVDKYNTLTKTITEEIRKLDAKQFETSDEILLVSSIKSLNYNLVKYAEEIKRINASLSKGQDIEDLYKITQEYEKIFTVMEASLDQINRKLEINSNKK